MQVFSRWTPPEGVLGELVAQAAVRADTLRERSAELARRAARAAEPPEFAGALHGPHVAVIAEVKRRSPSRGEINPKISAAAQSAAYTRGGAAALSILTEPERFGGCTDDLEAARAAVSVPILKKDFHVAELQIVEARALGASAALVIARAVPPATVRALVRVAHEVGFEALVEVRDEHELDVALGAGARVVGVNNRNLETLAIDLDVSERLVPQIPADRVAVFESGVRSADDVVRAAAVGADAVLVGSSLSAAADPEAAVRALANVRRLGRPVAQPAS